MFKISKTKLFAGILTLAILNFMAFFALKEGIGVTDSLEHAEGKEMIELLTKKNMLIDIFFSIILTIDIAVILLLLFFLLKMMIRTLKTSKNTQ